MSDPKNQQPHPVACPFLRVANPDTTSGGTFAKDCRRHGMGRWMAHFVTRQVTWKQQGLLAALRNRAPDVERLDEVPGVSHLDLYNAFPNEVSAELRTREVDGMVHLDDLVAIKESIAIRLGVDIIDSSRIETALLFVMAGGNPDTGTVAAADVLRLLAGEAVAAGATVTAASLGRVRKAATWTR